MTQEQQSAPTDTPERVNEELPEAEVVDEVIAEATGESVAEEETGEPVLSDAELIAQLREELAGKSGEGRRVFG